MEEYFTGIALQYDKPIGKPLRYDPFLYHHQVPGGMISNLRSQLRDMDMEDRLEAVLEEAGQVREDLGYPIIEAEVHLKSHPVPWRHRARQTPTPPAPQISRNADRRVVSPILHA